MTFDELKEQNNRIMESLEALPEIYAGAERLLAETRANLNVAKDAVSDAELEAELSAVIDGKNAEERKRQKLEALSNHPGVKMAKQNLYAIEAQILEKEAEVKEYSLKFRAAIALAELQTARMNFFSKVSK